MSPFVRWLDETLGPPWSGLTSKVVGGVPFIEVEAPRRCTECCKVVECRPYGKNGAQVCFKCAMATPETKAEAERQMGMRRRIALRVAQDAPRPSTSCYSTSAAA